MALRALFLIIASISLLACKQETTTSKNDAPKEKWMLGFNKTEINPLMVADSSYSFLDPITKESVQWQKADVFNPGAIVRNDTVFILWHGRFHGGLGYKGELI